MSLRLVFSRPESAPSARGEVWACPADGAGVVILTVRGDDDGWFDFRLAPREALTLGKLLIAAADSVDKEMSA